MDIVQELPSAKTGEVAGELDFMDAWYPIQVKQKDRASRPDIDAFETAMNRAERAKGFFVSFAFTDDAMAEVQRYFVKEHKTIVPRGWLCAGEKLNVPFGPPFLSGPGFLGKSWL